VATDALTYLKTGERPPKLWLMDLHTKLGMMGQIRSGMQPAMEPLVRSLVLQVAKNNKQLVLR